MTNEAPVALVAGASQGIGRAASERFLAAGWRVCGVSRSAGTLAGENYIHINRDLTVASSATEALGLCKERWGRLDAVVHSVGEIFGQQTLEAMSLARWRQSFSVCVETAVNLVAPSIPELRRSGGACVLVSSIAGQKPYPGIADYCAAKAALSSLCRSLAHELAPAARANSVSPAVVDTRLFRKSPYSETEAAAWHRLGRIGKPADVADLIWFLCSDSGRWITGRDYVIDGGFLL
jgi:NAD(P)-dependent dehydrogenase (short-subunit alcohol dehydrogenase family)